MHKYLQPCEGCIFISDWFAYERDFLLLIWLNCCWNNQWKVTVTILLCLHTYSTNLKQEKQEI